MTGNLLLDIRSNDLDILRSILRQHVPDREVRAFGSRVNGTARKFSDLDLVVMGETPLSIDIVAVLSEAFSDSNLPFKVDIVDWASVSPQFQAIIQQMWVTVQTASLR